MAEAARPVQKRDTSRDGTRNKIENFLLNNFRGFWGFINDRPAIAHFLNRFIVDNAAGKAPARPLMLGTMSSYVSWPSLTDRTWFSRYLPELPVDEDMPSADAVTELFRTPPGGQTLSKRSTLLFPSFAQWFTDGFLMTNNDDRRRTRTTHQIELNQLYGLSTVVTRALRTLSEAKGRRGRLKTVSDDDGEWAPRLYDAAGVRVPEFVDLPEPTNLPADWPAEKKAALFAFGGERSNSTLFTAAMNTLFLREHNRLAAMLERNHPAWDDERVFQTARNINIVQLIKVVVEDYINHISPYWFRVLGDPRPSYHATWNRPNWIPVEFNLLYRWHSLVPATALWKGEPIDMAGTRFDNRPMIAEGLGAAFDSASRTIAAQFGMFNTSDMLLRVEWASIIQGRDNELASYNDYRELMHFPRVTRFEQISERPEVVEGLRRLYGDVDRVELFTGLFAEDPPGRSAIPPLLGRMVTADAFSHALTNPLLAPAIFTEQTFTPAGMAVIKETTSLQQLFVRNCGRDPALYRVSMEREGQG